MLKKKRSNRSKYRNKEYLPSKLIIEFNKVLFTNSNYEYRSKNNFLKCLGIIFHYQMEEGNKNDFVPLGSGYWKKVFGGNYHVNVIQHLLNHSLIESYDYGYRTFPNLNIQGATGLVGIRYRINPMLMDVQFQEIYYINNASKSASETILAGNAGFINTGIKNLNFNVTIDQQKANEWVENYAENICNGFLHKDFCKSLPDSLIIEYHECIGESYNAKYKSVKVAKFNAEYKSCELFYFKDKFYIADIQEFIKKRIETLKYNYKYHISRISTIPIEEKRSPVTLRSYSDLTSFPSKILPFININYKSVVQLDLRTSQFLIFANLINVFINKGEEHLLSLFRHTKTINYLKRFTKILKEHQKQLPSIAVDINNSNSGQYNYDDTTKFIRDVFYNDFYDVVQTELELPQRLLAKQLLFRLLFKKTNRPDALLNKLSKRYPIVMNIIANFKDVKNEVVKKDVKNDKSENQESNFSLFLQCIESELFIDNILDRLRLEGVPCFTRHDSIVVSIGYEKKAEEIAMDVFKNFGFRYNHKSEELFWNIIDPDELEEGDSIQWLIDENIRNEDCEYYEEDAEEQVVKY